MKIIGLLLLFVLGLYFLKRVLYVLYVKSKKKSKEVELIVNFVEDKTINEKKVVVAAPFYNEENAFHFGIGLAGIQIGYTPVETIPKALKKIFANKNLIQVCHDDLFYPNENSLKEFYRPQKFYEDMRNSFDERGISIINGAFLYTPESIEKGGIEYGISDGTDLFYICNEADREKLKGLMGQVEGWQKLSRLEAYKKEKEFLNAEGELFHQFEAYQLVHREENFLLFFVNEIFKASIDKFFKINNISKPSGFEITDIKEIFESIFNFSSKPNLIKMYLEDNNFIIYREQERSYEVFIKPVEVPRSDNKLKDVLSYFIPAVIGRKAYSKGKLKKSGVQFFFLSLYIIGIVIGVNYLMFGVLHIENNVLLAVSCFAAPILAVVSFVLSVYYLSLGIFSRNEFVQAGI